MFKIIERPEFTHEVTVMAPVDGGHREETFKARFRVLTGAAADVHDLGTTAGLIAFLKAALVGVEDVVGADDRPQPWCDALRDHLLSLPYVRLALLRTYTEALTRARLGN